MVRGSVVECRVYPEVGPGEKAADVHFEYVQAAVFEAAALEEPRHHVMASDTRSGEGGASEPRSVVVVSSERDKDSFDEYLNGLVTSSGDQVRL